MLDLPIRHRSRYRARTPREPLSRPESEGSCSRELNLPKSLRPPAATPSTPRHGLRVYNDSIPASLQPQTPQHLRESRHQSRFHPAYTAPVDPVVGILDTSRSARSIRSHHRNARSDSPRGMRTPGFEGLYGGQENTDDDQLFDRAARRLWALVSARRDGRSLSHTPERELSFADDRGDYH